MLESILLRTEAIFLLGGFGVAIVAIVSSMLTKMHQQSLTARLKEQMLSQGMSVDEIERVLNMGEGSSSTPHVRPQPPRKPSEV